jgi:hypothetical protein
LAKLALFRAVNVEELPPFLHDCEIRSVPSGAVLIEADQRTIVSPPCWRGNWRAPGSRCPPIVILGAGETVGSCR